MSFISFCSIFLCLCGSAVRRETRTIVSTTTRMPKPSGGVEGMCNPLSVPRVCLRVCWVESSSPESRLGSSHDQMLGPPQPLPLRGGATALPSVPLWCLARFPLSENEPTHSGETHLSWCCFRSCSFTHLPYTAMTMSEWRTTSSLRALLSNSSLLLPWQNIPSLQKLHQSLLYLFFLPPVICYQVPEKLELLYLRQQLFPGVQRAVQQTERCWSLSAASPIKSSWRSLGPLEQCHQQNQGQISEVTKPEMLRYFT